MLARRPDRCDSIIRTQASFEPGFRLPACRAPIFDRGFHANARFIDHDHGKLSRASDDDDGIATAALARNRKSAAGERVVDASGQRTLADHRKLGRRRQRAADQGTESKNQRSFGRERIHNRRTFVEQQLHAQAAAAEVLAQDRIGQRRVLGGAFRHVDPKVAPVITEGHELFVILRRQRKG